MVRVWHDVEELFASLSSLRLKLMDHFPNELAATTCTNFKLGYFEPPSNTKRWLVEQRDLQEMYKSFSNGARITLWCERLGSDPTMKPPHRRSWEHQPPEKGQKITRWSVSAVEGQTSRYVESNTISLLLFAWFCYVFYVQSVIFIDNVFFSICLCIGMESAKLRLWPMIMIM